MLISSFNFISHLESKSLLETLNYQYSTFNNSLSLNFPIISNYYFLAFPISPPIIICFLELIQVQEGGEAQRG